MEYFNIDGFPDYRLVRLSERDFYVESCKKGEWERIGSDSHNDGHINIVLYNKGVRKNTSLHVLVAEMFVPNPDNKEHVHHIDFDATNNDPANLMFVTPSEHKGIHNELDNPMWHEECRKKNSKTQKGKPSPMKGKPKPEGAGTQPIPVEQWSLDGTTLIARYESMADAERQTGINRQHIGQCCNGKRKSAGGYKWRYAD